MVKRYHLEDRYPTDSELDQIKRFEPMQFMDMMRFIREIWNYEDIGYWQKRGRTYWLHTGGWSGNESIIEAMIENRMFWCVCWVSSKRGGHYRFHIPEFTKGKK